MASDLDGMSPSRYPEFTNDTRDRAVEHLQSCDIGTGIVFVGSSTDARRIVYAFERPAGGQKPTASLQADICDGFGASTIIVLNRFDDSQPEEGVLVSHEQASEKGGSALWTLVRLVRKLLPF